MAAQQPTDIKRIDLQQHDLSVPGREVVQVRVDLGPGAPFVKHTHPGEEIIYVLEGSLEYQVEGQPPTTVTAGDVLFVPAGAVHAVRNVGSGNAAELATYVVEKGKPILTLVERAPALRWRQPPSHRWQQLCASPHRTPRAPPGPQRRPQPPPGSPQAFANAILELADPRTQERKE